MTVAISPESVVRLHRLTEVSRALTWAVSLDAVLELAADCCVDLLDVPRVLVCLEDEDGMLRVGASRGVDPERAAAFSARAIERITFDLEALFGADAAGRFLGVPIVVRGRVRGLLATWRTGPEAPSESEEWLLSALADQTALAIEGAREEKERLALEAKVDQMEQSRSATEHALRIAGHDLRTPLNSMQGYLALLASGVFGTLEPRQADIIARIQQIGTHLNSVLENVFEIARLTSRDPEIRLDAVRASDLAQQALSVVEQQANDRGLRIRLQVPDDLWLAADPDRVRQVLVHLLDNAVKYAPDGSEVEVTGAATGRDWGRIVVKDEGPGIPAGHAEAIFEPGHRVVGERDPGGTGLGLSIARELVRAMDGDLRLLSPGGPGSRFELRLRLGSPG